MVMGVLLSCWSMAKGLFMVTEYPFAVMEYGEVSFCSEGVSLLGDFSVGGYYAAHLILPQ